MIHLDSIHDREFKLSVYFQTFLCPFTKNAPVFPNKHCLVIYQILPPFLKYFWLYNFGILYTRFAKKTHIKAQKNLRDKLFGRFSKTREDCRKIRIFLEKHGTPKKTGNFPLS